MRRHRELQPTLLASRENTCCQCGMRQEEWAGSGYKKEGWTYCCQRCAEETGCDCYEAARLAPRERSLPKRASLRR